MKFEFLADRQDAIPILGRWYNQEWGKRLRGESEAQTIERLEKSLNINQIPFILVATQETEILGAAQLKYREMEELFPEKEHWLGGVFVSASHRRLGIGSQLIQEIVNRASSYGVDTLHLQTEQFNGGLYTALGWRAVQQVSTQGLEVLVMERSVIT